MYRHAQKVFYGLSIFVLMTGLFVLSQPKQSETALFQNQVKQMFATAAVQTFGDQPVFDNVQLVFDGVENFYSQSAQALTAMMQDQQSDQDLAFIFGKTYLIFSDLFQKNSPKVAGIQIDATTIIDTSTFMTEEPIFLNAGKYLGVSTEEPVNATLPWVTIRDNLTGQLYCLAIYNGEINKYLGQCKRDAYH